MDHDITVAIEVLRESKRLFRKLVKVPDYVKESGLEYCPGSCVVCSPDVHDSTKPVYGFLIVPFLERGSMPFCKQHFLSTLD